MCGIAGFLNRDNERDALRIVREMTEAIAHRGPDADGHWLDADAGIALGHRRLSIVDLSPQGSQPMVSASGRYIIVYNGEIYNFLDIRESLESLDNSPTFRGTSDTEVMLAAFDQWGIIPALERFVGMFSFALWDRESQKLFLARDRMGEKPLFYGWMGTTFLFGSELKALRAHPDFRGEVNRNALTSYMRYQYVPTPFSIYENIHKLPPGTVLTIDNKVGFGDLPDPIEYWNLKKIVEEGHHNPIVCDDAHTINQLENLLMNSVRQQMISDVPLGAFLSGGIDSSTVVALMQAQSNQPIKTFSIGFSESDYNEAVHAKEVAEYLGTNHTELYVSPQDALNVIPKLPTLWDEPFGDSSQIPTYLVAQLARQQVTVSLSGDGGDELFAGYPRYFRSLDLHNNADIVPDWQVGIARQIPSRALGGVIWGLNKIGTKSLSDNLYRVRRLSRSNGFNVMEDYRTSSLSHWHQPDQVVLNGHELPDIFTNKKKKLDVDDLLTQLTYIDMSSYLLDDILVKVDRAAMGVSLETRVPLLDHRVVEFSQRLPQSMKIRNGVSKWILKQVLYRHVPQHLIDRPKMGFGVPIHRWLRHELRDWAEALLEPQRLKEQGYFDANIIHQHWQQHLSGMYAWQGRLWDILMFQAWLERQNSLG